MSRNSTPFVEAAFVVMFCGRELEQLQGFADEIEGTGDEK
jgi:hypothetical protein